MIADRRWQIGDWRLEISDFFPASYSLHNPKSAISPRRVFDRNQYNGWLIAFCLFACIVFVVGMSGCNPFAPGLESNPVGANSILSDGKTVDGIFQNMRYAYTFKDTLIYGSLIDNNFVFTYRDYEAVKDVSWGRDEEMRITYRLFQNAAVLNLIWNNKIGSSEDSLRADVTRSFTLTVTFNPNDIVRVDGRASLKLQRSSSLLPWKIIQWRDESNY